MTIRLTGDEFWEQFQEAEVEKLGWDPSDKLDIIEKFDAHIAQGWRREVCLREGIIVEIWKSQPRDHLLINYSEYKDCIAVWFSLSGNVQEIYSLTAEEIIIPYRSGKYFLHGNGYRRPHICDCSDTGTNFELCILIQPEILRSFTASPEEELPKNLQHLIRSNSQAPYMRSGDTTPMMAAVVRQILHCPHQGLVKRVYLESKAIELMSLVLAEEIAIGQGEVKKSLLKPKQIERIYYAKEILLQEPSNYLSSEELARLSGLNDFTLRQGFHYCFGTTPFKMLQSHRLEQAKQLLTEQDITVAEVAGKLGYTNQGTFGRAFKKKFGLSPKEYQLGYR